MRKIFLISTVFLFLSACVEKESPPPSNALDPNVFASVMIDIQLAEGRTTQKSYVARDKNLKVVDLYPTIFEKHNVDPEDFLATYEYYITYPGMMEKIYEQVLDSLTTLNAVIKKASSKVQHDENDSLRVRNRRNRDSLKVFHGLK